jgi:predicted O-methyltransferase YrrM
MRPGLAATADDREGGRLLGRLAYAARAAKAFCVQPYEAFERTLERLDERRDAHRIHPRYEVADACEERVHQLIGARWPCEEWSSSEEAWQAALDELAARGLRVGRGEFGGWDDGDARFVRIAWCLARHLQPERILETGVGRGLTTRVLLEALERNGSGRLWSVDLAPLLEYSLGRETAAAVPQRLYDRWTLLRGSSRRVLPTLVADLGRIDLFIHDSMHTTRNLSFELERVWPALAPGGAAWIDDVEKNVATAQFLQAHPRAASMICASGDGVVLLGCLIKPSGTD